MEIKRTSMAQPTPAEEKQLRQVCRKWNIQVFNELTHDDNADDVIATIQYNLNHDWKLINDVPANLRKYFNHYED